MTVCKIVVLLYTFFLIIKECIDLGSEYMKYPVLLKVEFFPESYLWLNEKKRYFRILQKFMYICF